MVFVGGFIPYVGGFITTTILVLVTLSTQGISAVVLLLIGITIVNVVNGNILGPVIYGKTVSIHPALVLVSLPAGAAVAGIIGLFVAIPVVAIVLAVWGALLTILDPGPEYETPELVPGWLDRLAQWSWRLIALIVVVGVAIRAITLIPTVAVSIVLGVVLAATFLPFVLALVRRGWRRGPAAAATTAGVFLAVIVVVIIAMISLVNQGAAIATTSTSGAQAASDAAGGALGPLVGVVKSAGQDLASGIASVVAGIASLGVVLLLSGLLCFYFLLDGHRFWGTVRQRLRGDRLDFCPQGFTELEPVPAFAHDDSQQQGRFALAADQKGRRILVAAANLGNVGKAQRLAVGDDWQGADLIQIVERAVDPHLHLRPVRLDRACRRDQILLRQRRENRAGRYTERRQPVLRELDEDALRPFADDVDLLHAGHMQQPLAQGLRLPR